MNTNQNPINGAPYLRTSRQFPEDAPRLSIELDKSYLEIANAVNTRTIGLFALKRNSITGESWYVSSMDQKQQTLRQVYTFSSAGNINHGINFKLIQGFTRIYGTFTNGSIWYPLPYVDVIAANNQVNVIVNNTNIVITRGGGAPPVITSGFVVLEWLSNI